MKYEESGIKIICDGCGAKESTTRVVAFVAGVEAKRVVRPRGWVEHIVTPAIVRPGPPRLEDPFASPPEVASQVQQPVLACLCPRCTKAAADGAAKIEMPLVISTDPVEVDEDVVGDLPRGPVMP